MNTANESLSSENNNGNKACFTKLFHELENQGPPKISLSEEEVIQDLQRLNQIISQKKQELLQEQLFYKLFPHAYKKCHFTHMLQNTESCDFESDIFIAIDHQKIDDIIWLLHLFNIHPTTFLSQQRNGLTPLHNAILKGNTEIIMILLSKGANLESKTQEIMTFQTNIDNCELEYNGLTSLHLAVILQKIDVIKFLCENYNPDVETTESINNNSLLLSYLFTRKENNFEILSYLLSKGANPNTINNNGLSPLIFSIKFNMFDLFTILLDSNAIITDFHFNMLCQNNMTKFIIYALDHYGFQPSSSILLTAFHQNWSLEVLNLIISSSNFIDLNAMDENYGTPLLLCIKNNKIEYFSFLLSHFEDELDFSCCDIEEKGCLHYAVLNNNMDLINTLLEKGCDIDSVDMNNQTPLHLAVLKNNQEIVSFLIEQGADINSQDRSSQTALHIACAQDFNEIIRFLLENDHINLNIFDINEKTPFSYALEQCNIEIIKLFLHHKNFDINFPFKEKDPFSQSFIPITPFLYSLGRNRMDLFSLFIENGADILKRDSNGASFLHYSAKSNNSKLLATFFPTKQMTDQFTNSKIIDEQLKAVSSHDNNFSLYYYDQNHKTPVHYAAQANCLKSVEFFRNNGYDLNESDSNGITPLMDASFYNSYDITKLILNTHKEAIYSVDSKQRHPFHFAVLGKNKKIIDLLYSQSPEMINSFDANDENPLFYCLKTNDIELFSFLLKKPRINVTIRQKSTNITILHQAIQENKYEFVQAILLSHQIDASFLKDLDLIKALSQCSNPQIIKLFI